MSKIPANPLILVDGSSYLFRAYHALPPLTNSKGQPTGAIYGVINMLRRLKKDYSTENFAVIFDPKGKTFRNDLYKEYKANRDKMPDELVGQIKPLFDIIKAMGFPLIIVDGYEADDVIGTLVKQAQEQGLHSLVSTGDKDMAQLVGEHVTLINTMNDKILDRDGVIEKFGLPPELIIDYLTLMGDNIDNIPGVPGVGPKTAVKWLLAYNNLQNIVANAAEIKGKVGEKLRNHLDNFPLAKQLVTINCDVPLNVKPNELTFNPADNEKLIELFKELEFKNWLMELQSDSANDKQKSKKYETILEKKTLSSWLKKLEKSTIFAFDTETTSLDYMDAEIVGLSFSVDPDSAIYIPLAHDYLEAPEQLNREETLAILKPLLEDAKIKKVGHNLKYDKNVLANHGINLQGIAYDTMLESYVLSSSNRNTLDNLALKYLDHNNIKFEDVAGKGAKQLTFNQVPIEQATPYAAEDADICLQLHQLLLPEVKKEGQAFNVLTEIEMPLIPILSKMERTGVLLDVKKLAILSKEFTERLDVLAEQIYSIAEEEFNISSTKQLQVILFDKLNLPILEKTPKGQASTAESVLQELSLTYEIAKKILAYRSLSKLKSTYVDKLPDNVNTKTGRIHTSYHQAGTATGRFSSTDPNLQNIPIKTEEGRRIRQAFIAQTGYKIVAADYSQIELRIMADMSGDTGLKAAFANNLDIHSATASEIFNTPLEDVTSLQRRNAKAINFGLIYGMSAFGLARQLEIERSAAQDYINRYFDRYPGVLTYMNKTREQAHDVGYVETLFGRRLYLPEINSKNIQRQKAAERAAINAPMQGTAADIIKRVMIMMNDWMEKDNISAHMLMQVHDELVFEVAEKQLEHFIEPLQKIMVSGANLSVPLLVGVGVGSNWDEAH